MILNILNWVIGILSGIIGGAYFLISGNSYTGLDILKCVGIGFLIFVVVWICICLLIWIVFVVIGLTINYKKEYNTISKFYSAVFAYWDRYVCAFTNIRIHISGEELIPHDRKFLCVCNHRSAYDCFINSIALKNEKIAYISKPENFAIPVARNYMKRELYLAVDRENVRNALKTILKATEYITTDNINVGVFPEGTRSKTGELGPFKPGCLKVAERAECPILVCTIQGTENITKNFFWKKTDVYFDFIRLINPEEFSEISTVDVSDEIHKIMLEKLGK